MGRGARSLEETGFSVVNLFQQAGFQINEEKSSLLPTQSLTFLGYVIDTVKMAVSLPQENITDSQRNSESSPTSTSENSICSSCHRPSCLKFSCSLPRTPPLSLFGKRQDRGFVSCPVISRENKDFFGIKNGATVVDSKSRDRQ